MTSLFTPTNWESYVEQNLDHVPYDNKCVTLVFDEHREPRDINYIQLERKNPNTIFNKLKKITKMKDFIKDIQYLGLEDFFHTQNITLFAPKNSSLQKYALDNEQAINFEKVRRNRMFDILNAHILQVPFYPEQMVGRISRIHTLLEGYYIVSDKGKLIYNTSSTNDTAAKILDSVKCDNGMIYVIDKFVYPDTLVNLIR